MAILGIANTVVGGLSALGIGGTSDADKRRMAEADTLFNRALAGDTAAEIKLRCLAGNDQSVRAEAIRLGHFTADEIARGADCGYATEKARSHAAQKVAELAGRRTLATVAGVVAPAAAQVGMNADPGTFATTAAGVVASRLPGWVLPATAIGAGVLLFAMLRKG